MANCPECDTEYAYIGFTDVCCVNPFCKFFDEKQEDIAMEEIKNRQKEYAKEQQEEDSKECFIPGTVIPCDDDYKVTVDGYGDLYLPFPYPGSSLPYPGDD